jgi:hypothetical protein
MLQARLESLIPVLVTAVVTIFGWYATYLYTKRREDRTRRLELALMFRQRQIEELYGPLYSLIQQIFNIWRVRTKVLEAPASNLTNEQRSQVREFFWQHFFAPLHSEIGALLRTKLYLLESSTMPVSFKEYLEHVTQESCQHRLWADLKIDTSDVPGQSWPQMFSKDVKSALDGLMVEHRADVGRLQGAGSTSVKLMHVAH